jgi:hypothetical protein
MTDRAHMIRPCENCPYRTDAPRGYWHKTEFESVLAGEADPMGKTFSCHKQVDIEPKDRGLCAGWLLDQKARGIPSISLRMTLIHDKSAGAALEAVTAEGLEMFPDVASMCIANGIPERKVRAALAVRCIMCKRPVRNTGFMCKRCMNLARIYVKQVAPVAKKKQKE